MHSVNWCDRACMLKDGGSRNLCSFFYENILHMWPQLLMKVTHLSSVGGIKTWNSAASWWCLHIQNTVERGASWLPWQLLSVVEVFEIKLIPWLQYVRNLFKVNMNWQTTQPNPATFLFCSVFSAIYYPLPLYPPSSLSWFCLWLCQLFFSPLCVASIFTHLDVSSIWECESEFVPLWHHLIHSLWAWKHMSQNQGEKKN